MEETYRPAIANNVRIKQFMGINTQDSVQVGTVNEDFYRSHEGFFPEVRSILIMDTTNDAKFERARRTNVTAVMYFATWEVDGRRIRVPIFPEGD